MIKWSFAIHMLAAHIRILAAHVLANIEGPRLQRGVLACCAGPRQSRVAPIRGRHERYARVIAYLKERSILSRVGSDFIITRLDSCGDA